MRRRRRPSLAEPDRRSIYFAFQGLLMAVLLLLFLYQARHQADWTGRFDFLLAVTLGSLAVVRLVEASVLGRWWFQAALFLSDAVLASLTLHWTQPQSDLYLIYVLIVFGTALARDLVQSLAVALVTSLLYIASAWHPATGLSFSSAFWLRLAFLWVSASVLAILSRDTDRAQLEQEKRYRDRLIQFERLATLGQMAGEVAHRIKGPLTTILVNAEVLAHRHAKSKDMLKELGEIQQEVQRCKQILKNLLDLGRIEEMDRVAIDVRDPLRFALKAVEPQLRRRGLKKDLRGLAAAAPAMADPSLLQEAFSAVLQNAVEASPEGGCIRVALARGEDGRYRVVIEDEGDGIAPRDLERIFEPFFTTKGKDGTGLGLSAALRILQKHGGTIDAQSAGERGARFSLLLPSGVFDQPA